MSISLYEMNITNSAVTGGSVVNGLVSGRKQSYTQVNMKGHTYNYYFGILKYWLLESKGCRMITRISPPLMLMATRKQQKHY